MPAEHSKQRKNIWPQLKKPILGLAPMDGVTNLAYRYIQQKYGKPDVIYTEFATVEGLCRGVTQPLRDFRYQEEQRPIIAQIYGTTPQFFREAAVLICQLGFDGIDINMGCPAKSVASNGAGAALIKTPQLAVKIIKETQAGVQDWMNGKTVRDCPNLTEEIAKIVADRSQLLPDKYQTHAEIPVSIKTRIGYDQPVTHEWISTLLETQPATIALHGRTLRQGYGGQAAWEEIGKAAQLTHRTSTLILGNGDLRSREEAEEKVATYGIDGALIGRASFGNPWIFKEGSEKISIKEKAKVTLEHAQFYEKVYQKDERYSFLPMRKHLGWYIKGFPNAKEVRIALVKTSCSQEVAAIFKEFELL